MSYEYVQVPSGDVVPDASINPNYDSLGQAFTFAHIPGTSSGLIVRIGGGDYKEAMRAGADLTATDDDVNYIVAARSNGALSIAITTTNWDDTENYGRVGIATFASSVLSYVDCRRDPGGIFDNAAAAGVGDVVGPASSTDNDLARFDGATGKLLKAGFSYDTDATLAANSNTRTPTQAAVKSYIDGKVNALGLSGFRYTIDLDSTAATDPGAGLLKFNNATLASVTAIYIDDSTVDSVDLSTLLGSLGTSGLVKITSVADVSEWRVYKWTAAPTDNTGWWTFTVIDQAGTGTFEDGDEVQVLFLQLAADGTGAVATDTIWDAAGDLVYGTGANTGARLAAGTGRQTLRMNSGATAPEWVSDPQVICIACSDETTALTTGAAKVTFRMPFAMTLTEVRASVTTAPTGSTLIVDINESGSTIMSTNKLSIDASEKTSTTAATAAGITDSSLADDAEITIDIDQVGSTIAGAGLKVYLIGHKT